jgi:hypothetical protein
MAPAVQIAATIQHAVGPFYSDVETYVPHARWLVADAHRRKDARLIYHENRGIFGRVGPLICKVCGGTSTEHEVDDHLLEHAVQLGIVEGELRQREADQEPLLEDLESTVYDAIFERYSEDPSGEVIFRELRELARTLAHGMLAQAREGESGDPVFCSDCTTN